jgi:hypothetical protein
MLANYKVSTYSPWMLCSSLLIPLLQASKDCITTYKNDHWIHSMALLFQMLLFDGLHDYREVRLLKVRY